MIISDSPCYDTYIIHFRVDVVWRECEILTSADDKCISRWHRFPLPAKCDLRGLTEFLLEKSMELNSDYVSEDHVYNLVTNAIDQIYWGMRQHGIRRLGPRPGVVMA